MQVVGYCSLEIQIKATSLFFFFHLYLFAFNFFFLYVTLTLHNLVNSSGAIVVCTNHSGCWISGAPGAFWIFLHTLFSPLCMCVDPSVVASESNQVKYILFKIEIDKKKFNEN